MKFRKRLFWGLAILVAVAMIYLFAVAFSVDTEPTSDAEEVGAGIGLGIVLLVTVCVGGPLFAGFALLGWRNGVGVRNQVQHQERMAIEQAKLAQQVAHQMMSQPPSN